MIILYKHLGQTKSQDAVLTIIKQSLEHSMFTMSQKVWLGRIYLKEEGGYEIVLRALHHYKKRLKSIGRSPELRDAAMFSQIVQQEAMKTSPAIDQAISKIKNGLENSDALNDLQSDIPIFEKALSCYQADIQKAKNNPDKFYSELIPDVRIAAADLEKIKIALSKIPEFT